MRRYLTLFIVVPVTIVVIVLSVANRSLVTFSLDPIGDTPALSLTAPFFFFLFAALGLGVLLGGIATWIGQGKWRRVARGERANSAGLRREVEQLRASAAAQRPGLPSSHRDAA